MHILIVEDEPKIAQELRVGLEAAGFRTEVARDAEDAALAAGAHAYDAMVVDVMLPGRSGLEFIHDLRARGSAPPVLVLSAKGQLEDRLAGLAVADDYLTKPYSILEVIARLRALLRRGAPEPEARVEVADLCWEPGQRMLTRGGQRIDLTPKECALIAVLLERPGTVVSRSQLVKAVWGLEEGVDPNAVDVQILRLRRKVDDPFPVKLIHTLRGVGLVLEAR